MVSVLHLITDTDRRGAQVYATDLSEGLSDLGFSSSVVALTGGEYDHHLDVEMLGTERYSYHTWRALRRGAQSADIVVAHGSSTLVSCAVSLFGTQRPFVYRQISDPLYWASSPIRRMRVATYLRRAAAVVALSANAADALVQHYRLSRSLISIIPNAVPAAQFSPAREREIAEARESFGLPTRGVIALSLGALVAEKGVDMAILATRDIDDLHLLVAGEGPARADLERLARDVAPGRVHFVGALAQPATALRAADLLLLPSRDGDSMPAVVIEAGLSGLPCVTTPVGSIAEIVEDGVTGLVTPIGDQAAFADATRTLVRDQTQRSTYGAAARDRCSNHYSIEMTAPVWARLLQRVVEGSK